MNDHRPYFRDMGALGYTFYDEVEQRYFRGMLFGYTRVVVGAALETYEHVWKGDMALFDKAPYPPPPAYIFEALRWKTCGLSENLYSSLSWAWMSHFRMEVTKPLQRSGVTKRCVSADVLSTC
jgi:hypothetical protein|eukprot:COSAG01_NODE_20123_length_969_cov_2.868966_2_plen_123_part_00